MLILFNLRQMRKWFCDTTSCFDLQIIKSLLESEIRNRDYVAKNVVYGEMSQWGVNVHSMASIGKQLRLLSASRPREDAPSTL